MIVLNTIDYNDLAIHPQDVYTLIATTGTIRGNYNQPYTVVTLKGGSTIYNVTQPVKAILQMMKEATEDENT